MTNAEFYRDEIFNFKGKNFCNEFIKPIIRQDLCDKTSCHYCNIYVAAWLMKEYKKPEEPNIDWENVPVDTPILVKHVEETKWHRRYFTGNVNERGWPFAFNSGVTSFTNESEHVYSTAWKCAKLWEGSEEQAAEKEAQCTD